MNLVSFLLFIIFVIMDIEFEEYLKLVIQRNKEKFEDGHVVEFSYTDDQIYSNRYYFKKCHEYGLSPYKALTFFHDELEEKYREIKRGQ